MFKSILIYRIAQGQPPALADIEQRLDGARFVECGAAQMESAGWIEPRGQKHGALAESIGGQTLLTLCVERKAVPGSAVKTELEARLDRIEQETGRRPKGKQARELKDEIVHGLLPRAFPKRATTNVWLAPGLQLAVVGAASAKNADAVMSLLAELLGGAVVLAPLQTRSSPAAAMSQWLASQEAPAGFSIDRECELKQPDSEKATVKYLRHTLEMNEVAEHIKQGKLPTQLAMTWNSRVSFVLTETLAVKKIKLLDVALEGAGATANPQDSGFDADVALITGELGQLIPDLIAALGGELPPGQPLQDAGGQGSQGSRPARADDDTPPWASEPVAERV